MRCSPGQNQHDDGIRGIEGRHRIEAAAGNPGLLALVNAEAIGNEALILKLGSQELAVHHEVKASSDNAVMERWKLCMRWLA